MPISLRRTAVTALVITVVCFLVAGAVGQHQDGWVGDPLPQWLGDVAWFGFLLGLLVTVLTAVALLVRRLMGRRSTDSGPAVP